MNRLIEWFASNPVAANLLTGFMVLGGLTAILQIPVKPFPDFEVPAVIVSMDHPGAAPEQVEAGICRRIEEAVTGIAGIKTVRSVAAQGNCSVRMDLFTDADRSRVTDEIEIHVQAIDTFPVEAEKLLIRQFTPTDVVAEVVVTGPTEERALKELGRRVRDDLRSDRAISQVRLVNSRPYEISVELSEASLQRNGMTFDEVAEALRRRSVDLAGGSIRSDAGEVVLRARGQAYWGEELEDMALRVRADGTRVLLKDVARVVDGFADTGQGLWFGGRPAALLQVARGSDRDAGAIVDAVRAFVAAAPVRYPDGVEILLWSDASSQLEDRLGTLLDAGGQGLLLVLLLLMLFLRPQVAIWVAAGIPIALLGALFLIYLIGLSVDAVSVIGLILALGLLVDDAVVVGEGVHRAHRQGAGQLEGTALDGALLGGAIKGAQEVLVPVTFGVLTTIAAFVPLLFATGVVGQSLSIVGAVVICCLIFSLVECQCILPAHLGHRRTGLALGESGTFILGVSVIAALVVAPDLRMGAALAVVAATLLWVAQAAGFLPRIGAALDRLRLGFEALLDGFIDNAFRPAAEAALRNRHITSALALAAVAVASSVALGGHLPFILVNPTTGDQVVAQLTLPPGADAKATRAVLDEVEDAAVQLRDRLEAEHGQPVIVHVLKATGSHPSGAISVTKVTEPFGSHLGEVVVQLTPSEGRPIGTVAVAERLAAEAPLLPEGAHLSFSTDRAGFSPDLDIRLSGDRIEDLQSAVADLRGAMAQYPGVHQIDDTLIAGKDEFVLAVTPVGETLGLSLLDVGRQVRQAFFGEEVQRIQRGEDDVRLMVRYTEDERRSLDTLDDMRIRAQDGSEVPLATVAELRPLRGLSVINRTDGLRSANVTAQVDSARTSPGALVQDLEAGFLPELIGRHPGVSYSLDSLREQEEVGASVLPLLLLALFAVYAMLSLPLKSYLQPLVVLMVVPFVWVGAVLGHSLLKLTGHVPGLSAPSIFGMIAASGVAINASLVLLHAVNRRRAEGASLQDALAAAAVSRFRPILITTATTFAGLAPLMFSRAVAAQSLVPLAISLAFGVLASAVAALVVVPSMWLAASGRWRKGAGDGR